MTGPGRSPDRLPACVADARKQGYDRALRDLEGWANRLARTAGGGSKLAASYRATGAMARALRRGAQG